jgi:hypothetical protein
MRQDGRISVLVLSVSDSHAFSETFHQTTVYGAPEQRLERPSLIHSCLPRLRLVGRPGGWETRTCRASGSPGDKEPLVVINALCQNGRDRPQECGERKAADCDANRIHVFPLLSHQRHFGGAPGTPCSFHSRRASIMQSHAREVDHGKRIGSGLVRSNACRNVFSICLSSAATKQASGGASRAIRLGLLRGNHVDRCAVPANVWTR